MYETVFLFYTVQKSCNNAEDECLHYKSLYERSQQELKDLAEKHKQVLKMFLHSLNFYVAKLMFL